MIRLLIIPALVALAACTQRPEVEALLGPEPKTGAYPVLVPLDALPLPDPAAAETTAKENAVLEGRAAALRSRAARIAP